MNFSQYFPVWDKLTESERNALVSSAVNRSFRKGEIIHRNSDECTGFLLVRSGQIRAYTTSPDGKEVTLYRLLEQDVCLFSASCMIRSVSFDISLSAEKDSEITVIPADVYKKLMNTSAPLANFTNELMASRFSDVMWLIEKIMWQSFDKWLASFLLEESNLESSLTLRITHESIGNHLGSPREVVTRMLRYFSDEGLVSLSRGTITICNAAKLAAVSQ